MHYTFLFQHHFQLKYEHDTKCDKLHAHYLYLKKTSKSDESDFQTSFLPDLFCIIDKDICNTMRPFNVDSGKTELTPFVEEILQILI